MPIEITSELRPRRLALRGRRRLLHQSFRKLWFGKNHIVFHTVASVVLMGLIVGGDSLLRSYKHYSRIIDARLENGYLTSRPGLYAAPRTLRVGQRLSREELISVLQRAGYVETKASNVWSGSFSLEQSAIDIRPSRAGGLLRPLLLHVIFNASGSISELSGDGIGLQSFTLEPEVLTNDMAIKAGQRKALAFAEIPAVLVHAILSAEDRRFFAHSGVDFFGIARALVRNAGDERMGQGGSTITQQLVKNTYLSPERTFHRKYAEAMLALALERRLSKEDIFALYCNEVYLGQVGAIGVRGVRQAADLFFGKALRDLSLNEAATIAGMIQSPSRYSPERHPQAAQTRRNAVLAAMTRDGWISSEAAGAAAICAVIAMPIETNSLSLAPYFVDYVNRVAESDLEAPAESQRVYTTIDLDLQRVAELALERQLNRLDAEDSSGRRPQGALVALDPETGDVLAMVGGRNYGTSQLNRATDARRQPGSTFKPFVYAAAIEDGFSPVQLFRDAPRDFIFDRNRIYRPANYGGSYSMQEVTLRAGLVKSLNVVTVDVAMQTGLARIANLASRFGLPKPERYPSSALGTTEATPLQMAAAYATFVNGGRRVEPRVISSVAEPPGAHSLTNRSRPEQVISPTTAYMITNMLTAVVDHGTARAARDAVKGTAIAGKTGTSHDGWFVGYSPNLVCAVWIGFDDNEQLGLTGAEAALPAWTDFMKEAVQIRPELGGSTFPCPEGIEFVEIDADNGLRSTLSCPNRELIAVTERLAPNLECYKHGNLPGLNGGREAEENSDFPIETLLLAQHSRSPNKDKAFSDVFGILRSTRVDVDTLGKRTLVNEMR